MSFDFRGRSALVTGATTGIGRAVAEALAAAGANVVLHGPAGSTDADAAVEACRKHGVRANLVTGDFAEPPETVVGPVADAALALEPGIDLLVNNAGACLGSGPFVNVTHGDFARIYRINVASGYFMAQHFVRRWLAAGVRGRICFTGSINGRLAEVRSSLYDSTKGAIEMIVRSLAAELAGQGVRVNGMAPGLVRTHATRWIDQRTADADWLRLHTPNGQIPDADACAGAVLYLLSDQAEHVHGHMLAVDGGMSAWQQPRRPQNPT